LNGIRAIIFIGMVLASSVAVAEAWDTFITRFFADKQFRQARTTRQVAYIATRISEREDEPLLCDMIDARPVLTGLRASLDEPNINIKTKQLTSARGVAMVYAVDSDAYFEQLSFSKRKGLWTLHRLDQGTRDFRKDYVPRKKCQVEPRYWLGFEQEAKVLYGDKPK